MLIFVFINKFTDYWLLIILSVAVQTWNVITAKWFQAEFGQCFSNRRGKSMEDLEKEFEMSRLADP